MSQTGVDISSYTEVGYECSTDGYFYYSGGANAGTGTVARITGPAKDYSRGMRVFSMTPVNGYGSCVTVFVRKGMWIKIEQCTGGAYAYFMSIA